MTDGILLRESLREPDLDHYRFVRHLFLSILVWNIFTKFTKHQQSLAYQIVDNKFCLEKIFLLTVLFVFSRFIIG